MPILIKKEGTVFDPGGLYDKTKVVSPDIVNLNGLLRLFYIGTSCRPEERKDYRILSADSKDGLSFTKRTEPIIDISTYSQKVYSPCVIKTGDSFKMYFASYENGRYLIRSANSKDCLNFKIDEKIIIDVNQHHQKAVYTPKVKIKNGLFHCYYTGSNEAEKTYSKLYPEYDFSKGFRIFYSTSKDGENFNFQGEIKFNSKSKFINYYGHNFLFPGKYILLFYTAFDGSINRIYLAKSNDGLNFRDIQCLIEPDKNKSELGCYSCAISPLSGNLLRIYYGVRYFDNFWKIHSALINLAEYI